MNELNMSIYTGEATDKNKVTLTAVFASHEDAVAFHDDLAEICRKHSPRVLTTAPWPKLLTRGK